MAEMQIGVYGGMNTNFNSPVTLHKGALSDSRTVDWEGRSFQMPPYWGAQATYWLNANASWGIGIDYTHSKAYAALNFATDPVYRHLDFTDGNNLLLLNLLRPARRRQTCALPRRWRRGGHPPWKSNSKPSLAKIPGSTSLPAGRPRSWADWNTG
jgi:hypothetical protein